jgi:hypothetical protein
MEVLKTVSIIGNSENKTLYHSYEDMTVSSTRQIETYRDRILVPDAES